MTTGARPERPVANGGRVPVRFGIVGSGFMAHTYAQCLDRHTSSTDLVAIGGGRRAPGLAAEYGVDAEPSVEGLVSRPDVDAVIIATPHSLHLPHTWWRRRQASMSTSRSRWHATSTNATG